MRKYQALAIGAQEQKLLSEARRHLSNGAKVNKHEDGVKIFLP